VHILVATDGSDRAEAAARFLHALIAPLSVERITVFTVRWPPGQVLGALGWNGFVPAEAWDEMEEEANSSAREALERAVVDLSGLAGHIETLARSGLPGEEIVRAAREIGADLIVIASHGWGELRAIIQGSVSERVLYHAACPVLVVPPPPSAAQTPHVTESGEEVYTIIRPELSNISTLWSRRLTSWRN
jgi:nucleotide-binding universal stress UspA family protein